MSKRSEYIGETGKTSVRVNHQAGQSQWSFGWSEDQPNNANQKSTLSVILEDNVKYHNESKIVF